MAIRKPSLGKRRLARLSEQIERLSPVYEDDCGAQPNAAETAFARMALMRGKKPMRNGWPDFLVYDDTIGGTIAVEVKKDSDRIRPSQARMFAALERVGLAVMVWDPRKPLLLQPWRKYSDKSEPGARSIGEPGARLPALGRMRSADPKRRKAGR